MIRQKVIGIAIDQQQPISGQEFAWPTGKAWQMCWWIGSVRLMTRLLHWESTQRNGGCQNGRRGGL